MARIGRGVPQGATRVVPPRSTLAGPASYAAIVAATSTPANHYWPLGPDSNDDVGVINGTDTNVTHSQSGPTIGSETFSSTRFVAAGSNVEFAYDPWTGGTDFSISMWYKIDAFGGYQTLFSNDVDWVNSSLWVTPVVTTNAALELYQPGGDWTYANDAVTEDVWHHVVVIYDKGVSFDFWHDGVLLGNNDALSTFAFSANLLIGGDGAGDNLDGWVCNVATFPGQLNATDVGNLYNGAAGGGGPLTGTANQTTETDLSQPITKRKAKAAGQNTETDLSQPITKRKTKAIGQNTEADTSQAITKQKRKTLGQNTETDTAQAVAWAPKRRLVNQISETDLAQALTKLKRKLLGQNTETDLAQPIAKVDPFLSQVAQATETDLAQPITKRKVKAIGQVTEADTAQAITKRKAKAVGQNSETDTSQAITKRKTQQIGPEFLMGYSDLPPNWLTYWDDARDSGATGARILVAHNNFDATAQYAVALAGLSQYGGQDPIICLWGVDDTLDPGDYGDQVADAHALWPNAIIELWNEPNHPAFGDLTPAQAAALTDAAVAAAPTARIIAPAVSPIGDFYGYVDDMVAAMDPDTFDALYGIGLHLYPEGAGGDPFAQVQTGLDRVGTTYKKNVYLTEIGFPKSEWVNAAFRAAIHQQAIELTEEHPYGAGFFTYVLAWTPPSPVGAEVDVDYAVFGPDNDGGTLLAALTATQTLRTTHTKPLVEYDSASVLTHRKTRLIGQVTETDTAQSITWNPKKRIPGQATETDTAQTITRRKTKTIGQATETDTAQAITRGPVTRQVAQASETDSAQAITKRKLKAVGLNSETDSAQAVTHKKTKTLGQNAETDTAQALNRSKQKTLGLNTETDLAQPVAWAPKKRLANQTTEADSAQAINRRKVKLLGQVVETDLARPVTKSPSIALETDTAQPITKRKSRTLGQTSEADSAQAVAWAPKRRLANQVEETDLAQPMAVVNTDAIPVFQADETDTAQPVSHRKAKAIGLNSEANTAQPISNKLKSKTIGQASETDLAQPVDAQGNIVRTANQATEADSAQHFTSAKVKAIGFNSETEVALPITRVRSKTLGQATETDSAQSISKRRTRTVAQATETDSAQTITPRRIKVIGITSETDSVQAVRRAKTVVVNTVAETDAAQTIRPAHVLHLNQAIETDAVIGALVANRARTLGQPQEFDQAQLIIEKPGAVVTTTTVAMHLQQSVHTVWARTEDGGPVAIQIQDDSFGKVEENDVHSVSLTGEKPYVNVARRDTDVTWTSDDDLLISYRNDDEDYDIDVEDVTITA